MTTQLNFIDFFSQNDAKILEKEPGLKDVYIKLLDATTRISNVVNYAALANILGKANKENVQGEEVMKLDELANEWLIESLQSSKFCAGVASEEMESFIAFDQSESEDAKYVVLFDPLDGSSNIDTCAAIGTIFSIYKRTSKGKLIMEDFLQKGSDILSAGYVIYGSSTILVYSAGNGTHGFTLDQKNSNYILSHLSIITPPTAKQFSINYGYFNNFHKRDLDFCHWCCEDDKSTNRPYSMRYIGSMVADFHRNLIKGGIFIYPTTKKSPKGKLRLMYECNPLSYVQKYADGKYTDGKTNLLEIIPTELHQRVSIAIGSRDLIDKYISF